ncbi:hypothetical protein K432DRAFT_381481 [Lepidopterella palustris CBS 459.81]|uniref:DUF3752 domain-containing protein n=1 Tax=Lepidopterella palustris CBS 459.81 TaxID=1314670 RepID=A0A8E2EC46_9PEZI|nr:hypothetical protein K432DRAFT_381481 [Lepidopterella palustris CBS 459.81]
MSSIGPQLPPHLLAKRKYSEEEEAPTKPSAAPSSSPESSEKRRRVLGPAPPPAPLNELPSSRPSHSDSEDSSSDDDDFGPAPPPSTGSHLAQTHFNEPTKSAFDTDPTYNAPKEQKIQRDEWMMVPPKQDDLAARMDPTKMRARKFASGKGARAPGAVGNDSAIWTETPEQKRKRLENEVMGVTAPANSSAAAPGKARDKEAEETTRRIREYNEKVRGKSLLEQHKKKADREKEDDPSKRAFDHEKDMGVGMKIGHKERKELLTKAADFGSRFQSGSYL